MVAYWAIIIFTVFILTYITYKISSFWACNFSPKILILCGLFACILGLLVPQVIAYASSITMWLMALLSLLVLSSYALSRSSDSLLTRETVETTALTVAREDAAEDILPVTVSYAAAASSFTGSDLTVDDAPDMPETAASAGDRAEDESVEDAIAPAESATEEVARGGTSLLDEPDNHDIAYYLELGFTAKEARDFSVAIGAFQKAIDIEPDNPSVFYIITEISAIFKLQGFYEKAIQQMETGRDLAITLQNHAMRNEFVAGIAYLRILKNVLIAKGISHTPYLALPEDVKWEIDEEFRLWKHQ